MVAKSVCHWQCCCRTDVPDYAFVLIFNPLDGSQRLGGFPALSGAAGQFLINDVALLGAAIWSLGKALIPNENPTIEP